MISSIWDNKLVELNLFHEITKNAAFFNKSKAELLDIGNSPSVAVLGVDVTSELHKELDNLKVSCANGIVEGGDALVVGGAWVAHLPSRSFHQLQFALERRV